jgi:Skp family chaperone for outer membrane proteins
MDFVVEFERRMLAELEEAGEENFPTLVNTVTMPQDATHALDAMRRALQGLLAAGQVEVATARSSEGTWLPLSAQDAAQEIAAISFEMCFDTVSNRWRCTKRRSALQVLLTAVGREKSESLLSELGYRWWRK